MNNSIKIYIFSLLVIFSCQSSDLAKMEVVHQESKPDEVSTDVILTYSDSGIVKRIIKAPLIHSFTKDTLYKEFPKGVHAQFFNNKGEMVTELTCGYGVTRGENSDNTELVFRDNVRIRNSKNETLISDEIYLVDSTLYSDSTVYIVTPTITLRGSSLKAPRDFSSYRLTNPVGVARTEALDKKTVKKTPLENTKGVF